MPELTLRHVNVSGRIKANTGGHLKKKGNKSSRFAVVGFYKKKLLFFVIISVFAFFGYRYTMNSSFKADTTSSDIISASLSKEINVELLENGNVKINGTLITEKYDLVNNELRLPVVDNPGKYINKLTINLTLPDNVGEIKPDILAVHGVGATNKFISGRNTVVYEANDVSPTAIITIVAGLSPSVIKPDIGTEIISEITGVKSKVWLAVAIFLPALTFVVMMLFLFYQYKRQKIDMPDKETTQPPMALPPAVVGALFNQKVGSREIAATLIDLAERGDILILDRERGFAFGKGKFDNRLLGFEKILLSKIFSDHLTADRKEIEKRINNHFYSKKMSLVTAGIYALATRLGYFKVSPQKSLAKYRLLGIFFFLLALGGFAVSLFQFKDPPYAVFFWVGMMGASLIISLTASRLPIRTIIGQEVLSNWYAFKKFLTKPEAFPYSEYNQQIFQKYLPYAIVMNCEAAWAKRFADHNFVMPEWFLTEKVGLGLEDFCLSLFPIVSYVSRSLSAIREPGFE